MPQMNPMWWLSLFLMFLMIFIMVNSLMYFMKNYYINKSKSFSKKIMFKWLW